MQSESTECSARECVHARTRPLVLCWTGHVLVQLDGLGLTAGQSAHLVAMAMPVRWDADVKIKGSVIISRETVHVSVTGPVMSVNIVSVK